MSRTTQVLMCGLLAAACTEPAPPPSPIAIEPAPGSEAWLARAAQRFIEDTPYRRAALEASLTRHDNQYARQRLGAYALGDRGWDLLPVWNPRSVEVDGARAALLERGEVPSLGDTPPLWDGVVPTSSAAWIALGRRVFFAFPLRAEVFMEFGLTRPQLADAVGVERTARGEVPGLVVFRDVDGETRVGITCAICHSAVHDGVTIEGRARRRFDYGRLRVAYHAATGEPLDADQARRMAGWGPGRADVTEDDDEDPVAIPDLWGLQHSAWLTQAGTIRHDSPLALAIRQDTQLIDANHQRIRPPRVLVWALTRYLYALRPPARPARVAPDRGRLVFRAECASCHDNAAFGGRTIAVKRVGTDPALANGRGRGTGLYRVPTLIDVARGAPYLHHGVVASLDALLSNERFGAAYRGGVRGPGPIVGHSAGTTLSAEDRGALIAYLETL